MSIVWVLYVYCCLECIWCVRRRKGVTNILQIPLTRHMTFKNKSNTFFIHRLLKVYVEARVVCEIMKQRFDAIYWSNWLYITMKNNLINYVIITSHFVPSPNVWVLLFIISLALCHLSFPLLRTSSSLNSFHAPEGEVSISKLKTYQKNIYFPNISYYS